MHSLSPCDVADPRTEHWTDRACTDSAYLDDYGTSLPTPATCYQYDDTLSLAGYDQRQSLSSLGSGADRDDPSQFDLAARARSASTASDQTAQSSFYDCSPQMLMQPSPIPVYAHSTVYDTPPLGHVEPSRLVASLERQVSHQGGQGRTVPGVSFGGPPQRPAVHSKLDDVAEGRFHPYQSGPRAQQRGADIRRRSSMADFALGPFDGVPTPKQGQSLVSLPLTPDPTPATFTLPGSGQSLQGHYQHHQDGVVTTPVSAVPRSMSMSVSRTLHYGTQAQVPPGIPRSNSFGGVSRDHFPATPPAVAASLSTYRLPAGSPVMRAQQEEAFEYFGYEGSQQQQLYRQQQEQQQYCANLASPMSLPLDRGHFQQFVHSTYSSAPASPYRAQQPQMMQHSPTAHQYAYQQPEECHPLQSPVSPHELSRRGSTASSAADYTSNQSLLLSASAMNRMLAARMPVNQDGTAYRQPMQQPLQSPGLHPLSASHSAPHSPPGAGRQPLSFQPRAQPHSYPLPLPSHPSGPVEAVHPRFRDPSPTKTGALHESPDTKPFGCEHAGCTKRFKRQEHLKRHERTHTQDKPYGCEVVGCGRWFSRSDNLTQHVKTHLKNKNGGEEECAPAVLAGQGW